MKVKVILPNGEDIIGTMEYRFDDPMSSYGQPVVIVNGEMLDAFTLLVSQILPAEEEEKE
jgi:hypothetical protein